MTLSKTTECILKFTPKWQVLRDLKMAAHFRELAIEKVKSDDNPDDREWIAEQENALAEERNDITELEKV